MNGKEWITALKSEKAEKLFSSMYGGDETENQRARYSNLIEELLDKEIFPKESFPETEGAIRFFTASGRTELGGNHTDHNHGKVLAASVQLDAIAAVAPRADNKIVLRSKGFPDTVIDISDTSVTESEKETTQSLLRGVAAGFVERHIPIKGWTANADSTVFTGSGLSSSAAIEVLAGKIFDGLYNNSALSNIDLAKIAQKAENLYYGKPSGLMDQAASASGGAVAIDFASSDPVVKQVKFEIERAGYAICVVNSGGSHADLTPDYGAIPEEMRSVASFFGAKDLRGVNEESFYKTFKDTLQIQKLREKCGDRAVLRSLHFFNENKRVDDMHKTLETLAAVPDSNTKGINETFNAFLKLVNASGDSSWKLLQNISSPNSIKEQGVSLALSLTKLFADRIDGKTVAFRVHGGGFAGTIQAYIPQEHLSEYKTEMEAVFGKNAVTVLKIRSVGTAEIVIGKLIGE